MCDISVCVTQRQMREYLIRLIYCEMLGVDCSWGYIHAVMMTQNQSTLEKRIGNIETEYTWNMYMYVYGGISIFWTPSGQPEVS